MNKKDERETVEVLLTVVVEHEPGCPHYEQLSSSGPAKVNSKAFRDNYDGIFGKVRVGTA